MSSTDSGESTHLPADDEPPSYASASCSSAKSTSAGPLLTILTHPAANGHGSSAYGGQDRSNGLPHQNGPYQNGPGQLNGHHDDLHGRTANGHDGNGRSANGHNGNGRAKPNGHHRLNGNGHLTASLRPRFSTTDL